MFEAVSPVPLSRRGSGGHSLPPYISFLSPRSPSFPLCFRLLDCQSLSHPLIVLVSIPFLTAQTGSLPFSTFFLGG